MTDIRCRVVGHDPVLLRFTTGYEVAGCARELRALDEAGEYNTKFPEVFWKNRNGSQVRGPIENSCSKCNGYGWDADWGGPFRCTHCWGTGRKLPVVEVDLVDGHITRVK